MSRISIIPRPLVVVEAKGEFALDASARLVAEGEAWAVAHQLAAALRPATGFELPVVASDTPADGDLVLTLDSASGLAEEEYRLDVSPLGVGLAAATPAGLFRGTQTLLQLLPPAIFRGAAMSGPWRLPAVHIEDRPRCRWRGMHLDCARHYMPREFIKKFIDLLALHKMNVFHWHLTEDQGWRLAIDRYPRLGEIAAWRDETMLGHFNNLPRRYDNTRHGGFYSKDDVREIVAYAAARHILVVPEIEMPGHAQAALAAYPELGCTGGPYQVRQIWGISDQVYCAGNDQVFEFLENVLAEVIELFPGRYLHIGGDECLKDSWRRCPRCQARIAKEGLKDEHELQSWFIRRIETFLNRQGRQLIGWDEILEGGLAPNATVMSWRGEQGGIEAARAGHDVVFAPTSHTYFDHRQGEDPFAEPLAIGGFLPLAKVYDYEPIPAELDAEAAAHVLGAQGQLWTEYLENPKQVEYMAFPRLCALAEVVWSPAAGKDFADFQARLASHRQRLEILDVNCRG